MAHTSLTSDKLYRTAELKKVTVSSTKHLSPLDEIVGQSRAKQAVEFAMSITDKGYNVFAIGKNGLGKRTMVMRYLTQHWEPEHSLYDWCYISNFQDIRHPKVLKLPAGKAHLLREDIEHLMIHLCKALPVAFDSERYHARSDVIEQVFKEQQEAALEALGADAESHNLRLSITTAGDYQFLAMNGDEPHSEESYDALSEKEKKEYERVIKKLKSSLRIFIRNMTEWEADYIEKQLLLDTEMAEKAVNSKMSELKKKYRDLPLLKPYFEAMQKDIVDHIDIFLEQNEDQTALAFASLDKKMPRRYQINILASNKEDDYPIIIEDNPTYHNIFGYVENTTFKGTTFTDFSMIRAGSIHKANGGVLLIDATKVLERPYVWDGLKRALSSQHINVSSLEREVSLSGSISLAPENIPLNVKIVLFGDYHTYTLLQQYDPEFNELFRITADFEEDMVRNDETELSYSKFISSICHDNHFLHCDRTALARVIEHSSREAEDQNKLSLHAADIANLLREANFLAKAQHAKIIRGSHVEKALASMTLRVSRLRDQVMETFTNSTTLLETKGKVIGQVNALSVITTQNHAFGSPNRITATTAFGEGKVLDIERSAKLGGNIHSKGVLILTAYLSSLLGKTAKIPLTAHIAFEQSYSGVDGDSASMAECCAIISSISHIPLRQDIAITGSMNQFGEAQPIGGVNEKIEGFFDVCTLKSPKSSQGVIIPRSNVHNLMLRKDIIHAVEKGKFHIYAIDHVNDAIKILTGFEAGEMDKEGRFPPKSVYFIAVDRLNEIKHHVP